MRKFESCRAHGSTRPFWKGTCSTLDENSYFVLCLRGMRSRPLGAAREREAKAYLGSLTPEQEAWVLRKMHFAEMGKVASARRIARAPSTSRTDSELQRNPTRPAFAAVTSRRPYRA